MLMKQTLVIASLLSLLVAGCSSNPSDKREVVGDEKYLQSPELRTLIVPDSMTVPTPSNEYYVFKASRQGEVGKSLDIRPPALPLPTVADSYATYESGLVQLDIPDYAGFWSQIPTILAQNNIGVKSADGSSIKTDTRIVSRLDDEQPVEASYLLQRKVASGREYITVELVSLKRAGQDLTSPIDGQYYTVELFNLLMQAMTPPQS